ncbi:hypothetical protein LCGC14_2669390, partial [marine sediment metagenome]
AIPLALLLVGGLLMLTNTILAGTSSTSVTVQGAVPTVTVVNISPDPIIPTENATTSITITATISDSNGCDDVFTSGTIAVALYRSGVGASCSVDDNNCYQNITWAEVGNTCGGGADTSGDMVATATIWYFTEATDASSTYSGETWQAQVKAVDESNASSTATDASPPELNSVYALTVDSAIAYGSMSADATSTLSEIGQSTTTVTNTGNYKIDTEVSGTDMTGSGTIIASKQKYATSLLGYESLTYTLSTSATARDLNIVKATSSSTPSTQDTYWGISIPSAQAEGGYSGTNTFTAIYSAD